ncbi:EmrB/QacA subfamily drug resistance transporter [Isoptericola sp. CG 20/1183]|uniref:EmrB/QacA subfamily drug resistance transporter n=1 Tax=Isoptericola halotolerans TaxID=300560 RepID=A0ABX5EGU5_9MICO|nr:MULTISPECIES: MDR family MFS transporter [Isoptericola]MCK0117039.1 MFS transporter [Isoptericola sp. S6320L]PRZ08237.1 EmrB/QacA subfamily drug resistance transporter [Isoptericola halotolerans]PRZ09034.1 EmrB/QacA subfamily drug resistance transporter [Isoptericola sp. CG 20/1183]
MTAQTADPQALPQSKIWAIFGGLMLAMLLAALDQTIVATALPTIVSDLGGAEHLSWVVTAYMLATTATTVLWGKLGDLLGRKVLFIVCIGIFLGGSMLCGTSETMGQLIAWRALQGVGGGGLMVLSQAIIGDVVSPRERGKYQGLFGAVFGVSSVAGPLLGGWFVDNLSWQWVFYINVPIGIVALVVVAAVLPPITPRSRPRIDYAGIVLLAVVSTAIVLTTSLGGTTWGWNSVQVYAMVTVAVVGVVTFVLVERRAPEPVLPLHLFRNRVFSVAAVVGFVVGFAMFGAITYLPLYLQTVKGSSPTLSGLEMTPMMLGLLLTSIGSGQLITRTGRYKVFPILGTAITAVGLFLLSLMDRDTTTLQSSLSMFVLGMGLGMVTQVLVIAVQNAVAYRDLGTATSGATYFRTIGSSVGVAVFGTIFANQLVANLSTGAPSTAQGPCGPDVLEASPQGLAQCPPDVQDWFLDGYADTLQTVFLWAVPVAVVAFALSWLLPQVELRTATRDAEPTVAAGQAAGETFALPSSRTSLEELRMILWRRVGAQDPLRVYEITAPDADLSPEEAWMITRVSLKRSREISVMAERSHASEATVRHVAAGLAGRGLVDLAGSTVTANDQTDVAAEILREAERRRIQQVVAEWPGEEPEIDSLVHEVSTLVFADATD